VCALCFLFHFLLWVSESSSWWLIGELSESVLAGEKSQRSMLFMSFTSKT